MAAHKGSDSWPPWRTLTGHLGYQPLRVGGRGPSRGWKRPGLLGRVLSWRARQHAGSQALLQGEGVSVGSGNQSKGDPQTRCAPTNKYIVVQTRSQPGVTGEVKHG